MAAKIIIEGIFLGALLALFCAVGIRNGAVNMVFLYHQDVQDRCVKNGLIPREKIGKNRKLFKVVNLIDRLLIDEYWVGHTKAWDIPGTEDLKPYISTADKKRKWIMGTAGMALISAVLSAVMCMIIR